MIWIGAIMCVVGGVAQLSGSAGPMQKGLVLVLLVGGAGFLLWMLYGTSYTFSPGGLRIRCGPFGILVPLSQIGSVVPSRNMLSSPACSLDRLLISYRQGRRKLLVSPEDKAGFLQALVARCTHLVLDGGQVTRRQSASRF